MPEEVTITIHWDLDSQVRVFRLRRRKKWGWRITQREDVPLMIIREEDGLRHEIPLDNVLYWSVDTAPSSNIALVGEEFAKHSYDRYCVTCWTHFGSGTEQAAEHSGPDHDVRRTCCNTSPQRDHNEWCTHPDNQSEPRDATYSIVGGVHDIHQPDRPDPKQPGVGG